MHEKASTARRTKLGAKYPNVFFREVVEPGRRKPVRTYEVGYRDSAGKQRWKSTGPRLDDALAFRDDVMGRRRKGERVETTNATFAEVAEAWLGSQSSLRPVTREAYAADATGASTAEAREAEGRVGHCGGRGSPGR